jgi:hypothetical protein
MKLDMSSSLDPFGLQVSELCYSLFRVQGVFTVSVGFFFFFLGAFRVKEIAKELGTGGSSL